MGHGLETRDAQHRIINTCPSPKNSIFSYRFNLSTILRNFNKKHSNVLWSVVGAMVSPSTFTSNSTYPRLGFFLIIKSGYIFIFFLICRRKGEIKIFSRDIDPILFK